MKAALACAVLLLTSVALSQTGPLTIVASDTAGDVVVPDGAYTDVLVRSIAAQAVTVGSGVTADSLTFQGTIAGGRLVVDGATVGSITTGAMTSGSISYINVICAGDITFAALLQVTKIDLSGTRTTDGSITFGGAVSGAATVPKPNISFAGLRVARTGAANTNGVYFGSTVAGIGGISFEHAVIDVTTTGSTTYALAFVGEVTVEELVLDGANVTATSTGTTVHVVSFLAALQVGRLTARGAALRSRATSSAYALLFNSVIGGTMFFQNTAVEVTATGATAYAGSLVAATGLQSIVVEDSTFAATAASGTRALYFGTVGDVAELTSRRSSFKASSTTGATALAFSFAAITDVGNIAVVDTTMEATATGNNAHVVRVAGAATRVGSFLCQNLTAVATAGTSAGALYFTTAVSHLGSFLVQNSRIAAHATSTEAGKGYDARALVFYATLSNVVSIAVESTAIEASSLRSFSFSGAHALQVRQLISHVTSISIRGVTATARSGQTLATAAYFEGGMTNVTGVLLSHTTAVADTGTSTAYAVWSGPLQTVGSFVLRDVHAVATAVGATAHAASFTTLGDVGVLQIADSNITATSMSSGTYAVAGTGNVDALQRLLLENVTATAVSVTATANAVSWTTPVTAMGEVVIVNVTARASASASASVVSFLGSLSHSGPIELRDVMASADAKGSSAAAFGLWLNVSSLTVANCTLRAMGSGASKALGFGSRISGVRFINVTDSVLEAATSAASAVALGTLDSSSDIGAVDVARSTVRALARSGGAQAIAFLNGMTAVGRFVVLDSTVEAAADAGPTVSAVYLSTASGTTIEVVGSSVTATALGSVASAVYTFELTNSHFLVRRCTISANASSTANALYATSMDGAGSLIVEGSNVTAVTHASNNAQAVYAGALTDVGTVRIVDTDATARSQQFVSYAVYLLSVTGTVDLTVEGVRATATSVGATAVAVNFGALSNVRTLTVQHTVVSATCGLASARAVLIGGTMSDVGTTVFRNITASAMAGTIATGIHFSNRVARLGSLTIEDTVVSTKTTDTNPSMGHSAWALMFYSSVSNVGPITVRNVRLTADAIQSSPTFGAHALQTRDAVSHVEKIVIEDVTAVARSDESLADVVVFASTMTNVSSLAVLRSTMTATAAVGEAHVLEFRGALSGVDRAVVSDSAATAVSGSVDAAVVKFGGVSTGRVLSVARSSLRARCGTGAAYAFSTGAIASVVSVSVTDSSLEAIGGSTAYAAYWAPVSGVATLLVSRVNASAQVQATSGAYAIGGTTLTDVGQLSVGDTVALATAASTAHTVTWTASLTRVSAVLLTNVTATSIAGALSATTQAVSFLGSVGHMGGPFELRDVRATAHGKSAAIMSLGVWLNATSLLILNSTLKATANGGSVKVVSFASRIEGLRYLNVTDSTLDADSAAATAPAALALALHVADKMSQVEAIDVVRASVRAVARDSGAHAVALMNTLADVGRVLVQDSTVEAVVIAGPTAYAVYISRAAGVELEVLDSTVSATSAGLTAIAVYTLALENCHVRVVRTTTSANSSTAAFALFITSLTDGGSIVVEHSNATAVARTSNTAQALYIGALTDVSAVSITHTDAEARAGTTTAYALNIVSLTRAATLRVEHVRASATGASVSLAVNVGIVSGASSVVIAHAVVVAISGVATARAVQFTGAVTGIRSVLLRNITATATADTSAGGLYFAGSVSRIASFVVEESSVRAEATTGTAAGTGHSAWALVFYASIFNVDSMVFRNVDLSADAARSSVNFGAHALHVRGLINHVPIVHMVDVTARAASDVIAMALRFEGAATNVSTVIMKSIVANASTTQPAASALACIVPSAGAVTIETLNVWLRSSRIGSSLLFATVTNFTLRGATVIAAASIMSVLQFATFTDAKFVITESSFDLDSPTVSIPKFTTVATSEITIEDSAFNFSSATAGAADAFLRIDHLRESSVAVRRCQLHAPHGSPAIFVYLVNSITSSRQSYAGVTAAKAFNSSYAPIKSQNPVGTSEVCVNDVEFLSESGVAVEYDPAPLRAQGFVVLPPGACRATMTPEPTPTIVPVLTPTATGSATITPPNTSTHTGTASVVDPPPTKTATKTLTWTPARTPTSPPTATAAGNTSNATATTTPGLTKSTDVTRSDDLPRTGTVPGTPSHGITATPVPTATVGLIPRPKAVPALLAEAQVAAQVTSSVSAVVSPVSALSAQRAAALTKTCPEDPPDGTEQLSFLDNPMQQSMGDGPARFHAAAVVGNMLLLIGGCLLCSLVGVGVAFASSVLPKHNHREEARSAGKAAYLLCIFLQCFGGEVFLIVSLLIVTPTCSAAVVCLGHPSSDVSVEERLIGAAALLVIAIVACGVSFFTTLARRYCYCPEEPPAVQAASVVLKDRAQGAPPPPWESQGDGEGSTGSDAELQASCGGERKWAAPIAVAQRVLKAAVIGPEWELRPEMRPLPSGVAKALMLLIGDSRPGITRPHLCFLDRRGCYWFFALDLWVAILTGVGVGVLELSHCEVAGAVAGLQFLYVFIFVVSRPLRSPLLLVVTFIALVLQSAAVIVAAATSSGLFKGKPSTLEDMASGSDVAVEEEEEDGTADLLDAVATALALVLAIQGIIGLLVGILTRYRRRQHEARRAHDVQHREAHVLMAPLLVADHGDFAHLDVTSDKPDSIDDGLVLDFLPERQSDYTNTPGARQSVTGGFGRGASPQPPLADENDIDDLFGDAASPERQRDQGLDHPAPPEEPDRPSTSGGALSVAQDTPGGSDHASFASLSGMLSPADPLDALPQLPPASTGTPLMMTPNVRPSASPFDAPLPPARPPQQFMSPLSSLAAQRGPSNPLQSAFVPSAPRVRAAVKESTERLRSDGSSDDPTDVVDRLLKLRQSASPYSSPKTAPSNPLDLDDF